MNLCNSNPCTCSRVNCNSDHVTLSLKTSLLSLLWSPLLHPFHGCFSWLIQKGSTTHPFASPLQFVHPCLLCCYSEIRKIPLPKCLAQNLAIIAEPFLGREGREGEKERGEGERDKNVYFCSLESTIRRNGSLGSEL